jgi:hypothetical protein
MLRGEQEPHQPRKTLVEPKQPYSARYPERVIRIHVILIQLSHSPKRDRAGVSG